MPDIFARAVKWVLRKQGYKIPTATASRELTDAVESQDSRDRDKEAIDVGCRIAFEIDGEVGERSWTSFMKRDVQSGGVLETTYGRRWYISWQPWIRVSGMQGEPEDFEVGKLYEAGPNLYFRRLF